jgi:hypothetical protein
MKKKEGRLGIPTVKTEQKKRLVPRLDNRNNRTLDPVHEKVEKLSSSVPVLVIVVPSYISEWKGTIFTNGILNLSFAVPTLGNVVLD